MSGILNGVLSCYPEYTLGLMGGGPRSMNSSDFLFRTGYGPFVSPLIPWAWSFVSLVPFTICGPFDTSMVDLGAFQM